MRRPALFHAALVVSATLSALNVHSTARAAEARPNVLFIMADDLNIDLGCYGHSVVKSPNVDRLAAHGVRFARAYCNYPVCNASRTSLLSGRRPDTTHVMDNDTPPRTALGDAAFLPEWFRSHGYRSIKVGKIYHTGDKFEDPRSWDIDLREDSTAKKPPANQVIGRQGPSGVVLDTDDANTWDGHVARKATELMVETAAAGTPFFVAAGFRRPHSPYIAPKKYFDLYDAGSLEPRPGPPEHLANIPDVALTYRMGREPFPIEKPGDTIAAYYASVSFMDAQLGVLLDALDEHKLWDNTVVVFCSDHGYHLGEHGGLWHKMTLFEEADHVPLLVAAPGAKSGAASPALVELVDLYPTLVELCGLEQPPGLEGTSLAPLLTAPERSWKSAVLTVARRVDAKNPADRKKIGRTIFTGRWRYTEWSDGHRELYDEQADPYEYVNLACAPDAVNVAGELSRALAAGWRAATPK